MKIIDNITNTITSNPITATLLLCGVVGVGTFFYKKRKEYKRREMLNAIVNSEEERALQNSNVRTIDDERAKSIAESLYYAMDGIGTDEDTILDLFVIKNRLTSADIIAINKAFGIQQYGTWGSPLFGDGDDLNLVGWFKRELSNKSDVYLVLQTKFNQAGIDWD